MEISKTYRFKLSDVAKRNVRLVLVIIGLVCAAIRVWELIEDPSSGKAWFNLAAIAFLTYICFDSFLGYQKRIKAKS